MLLLSRRSIRQGFKSFAEFRADLTEELMTPWRGGNSEQKGTKHPGLAVSKDQLDQDQPAGGCCQPSVLCTYTWSVVQ